jgi:hypothetical protein
VLATVFPLIDAASRRAPAALANPVLPQALEAAGEFRMTALRAPLLKVTRDNRADLPLREHATIVLARLDDDADVAELTEALRGGVLGTEGRFLVARDLLDDDVDAARVVLIDGYNEYLAGFPDGSRFPLQRVRDVLERAHDAKLIEQTDSLRPDQPNQTARNNIATLIDAMQVAGRRADELVAMAAENEWRAAAARYGAIHALGRVGEPEHVPVLRRLEPWPKDSGGDIEVQQRLGGELAATAIGGIRRRHWEHFWKLERSAAKG